MVAAASEVLAEKGAEAGVPEIAARAGVGKGTVYRCFPTKEHLISAVVGERLRSFTERRPRGRRAPDAWEAFVELLGDSAERQASDCTFAAGLSHESALPEVAEARDGDARRDRRADGPRAGRGQDARRASTSHDVQDAVRRRGADAARRRQPRPGRVAALRGLVADALRA